MRGIFVVEKDQIDVLELPEPEIGPYEVLVEVEACGICNSTDWKIIEGEFVRGTYPILLGHESVGRVVKVGQGATSFRAGDRVLRSRLEDSHVPFPGGRSCWGGFVERAIVSDVWAKQGVPYNTLPHPQQIVPPGIPPAEAVAMITLKETLSCLKNSDVRAGHSLAVVGTGPVAQTLVFLADLLGIHPLVVFGRQREWEGRFAQLGADAYAWGDQFPAQVRAILRAGGFNRTIEAVGAKSALARSLQVTRSDGRINLYGIAPASEPYQAEEESDRRVFRGKVAEAEEHDALLAWVNAGRISLSDWISDVMDWTEYQRAFDMVAAKRANKVVLTF